MNIDDRAALLLAGPRGRDACLALTPVSPFEVFARLLPEEPDSEETVRWWSADDIRYGAAAVEAVVEELLAVDAASAVDVTSEVLLDAVAAATGTAAYWQPPDSEEFLLARPEVVAALAPIAAAVVRTPAVEWWWSPVALADQQFVSWMRDRRAKRARPPALSGAAERLSAWVTATRKLEKHAHGWPADPAASIGSDWWSVPALFDVVTTSRSMAGLPATQLLLIEDELGLDAARVARLQPQSDVRIYEIATPEDWVALVTTYPLDVDRSRRHDWYSVTGGVGPWLIPNWAAVAGDYDGVHLTVLGYLATAGRALPVGASFTVLAGFEPDVTYWLNDVLEQASPPETWRLNRTGENWIWELE